MNLTNAVRATRHQGQLRLPLVFFDAGKVNSRTGPSRDHLPRTLLSEQKNEHPSLPKISKK